MRSLRLFLLLTILLPLGGLYPYRSLAQTKSRTLRRLEQERRQLLKKIEEGDKKLQQLRATTQSSEQTLRVVQQQVAQRREVVTSSATRSVAYRLVSIPSRGISVA